MSRRFPKNFCVRFNCENDAFFSMGFMYEVRETLNRMKLPRTEDIPVHPSGVIRDRNGNEIGLWWFEDEEVRHDRPVPTILLPDKGQFR